MTQELPTITELSDAEQTAASLTEVHEQLTDMSNKIRRSDSRTDSKLESLRVDLSAKIGGHDQQLVDIGRKLDLVLSALPGIATVQEIGGSSHGGAPRSQDRPNQVPLPILEPCHRNIRPGIRENLLKNVEMAVFEGIGIYSWIARVERFFRTDGYNDAEKLALVSVSLQGEALSWYNWQINRHEFESWNQFKAALILRFGNLKIRGPSQSLFCIKQTGTVADYVQRFEDLSSQVTGLDDQKLEGIFLNGLTQEMQELVHMQKPRNLPEMVAEARAMESSIIRRVVKKELLLANKENYEADSKSNTTFNNNTWKMKSIATNSVQGSERQKGMWEQRPRRHNSSAELDEKRRKGICFKCDGPWGKDHKCPNKELRVLTVFNGYEVEVLDDHVDNGEREDIVGECMALSFTSYRGISSPETTKVRGTVGKADVVIMLDSGATHNFISPAAVQKLKLK